MVVVYAISCFGSIGGGYISAFLLKRGYSINAARKDRAADLRAGGGAGPRTRPSPTNMWVVVGLVGLAAAAHQGWSREPVYALVRPVPQSRGRRRWWGSAA